MEEKIKLIGNMFKQTFLTFNTLNPSEEGDNFIYIFKEDRIILKDIYKSFNMKRFIKGYRAFEGLVLKYCLNRNITPIESALEIAKNTNK